MLIILSAFIIFNIFSHPTSSHTSCLNQTCGNVIVSFPFSLSANRNDCTPFSSFFELECNPSGKLYLAPNASFNASLNYVPIPLRVQEIKTDSLIVDISDLTALVYNTSSIELAAYPGPYFISDDNKFGSFGCSEASIVTAKLKSSLLQDFSEVDQCGCFVFCPADRNNPDCGNNLCCVVNVPQGSSPRYASYYAENSYYADATSCRSNCSNRSSANLFHPNYTNFSTQSYGLELKWALPSTQTNDTSALIQSPEYACSENANLTVVAGVPGYLCSCNPGYTGDGYSKGHGCKDVDECQNSSMNNCIRGVSTCQNSNGSYTCKCDSRFYVEDERIDGSQCRFSPSIRNAFAITGAIFGLAFLTGCLIFLAIWRRKRAKRKYFIQNGGLQLQKYVAPRGRETPKLFKSEELKAATNNYSDKTKLGVGGFGTVFKGTLADGRVVAIKKANRGTDGDSEQFLNEMAILTQINHRHIVRLLGFCLESEVPLLVYEYVSNGNVAQNLQQQESEGDDVLGWEQRLKVARQTADALAYLHAAASPPILHRDVKSANVLLDDNLDAKLADFGVSRLVPDGADHVSTAVQGTIGYLDPEYFQTLQLTDKSDVYSFGVMLVELITGLKPVDNYGREPRFTNLALLFIERMQEGRGDELIDPRLENPSALPGSDAIWRTHSSIMAVATLARRCLALIGAERPSMSHVVDDLRCISKSLEGVDDDDNEALPLLASEEKHLDYHKAGAVVAQNSKYHVHSSSRSINSLLDVPTMPR